VSVSFYVYYRVATGDIDALRRRIAALQHELARDTGVVGRLLVKSGEPLLWMEIYEGIEDRRDFEERLARALAVSKITELLPEAARKTEVFEPPG
jgi:hypothetical protein